jgi:hypothetical protein
MDEEGGDNIEVKLFKIGARKPKKKKAPELPLPPPAEVAPNSCGLPVGKSVSKDYFDFAACFEPMCAETPEGDALRVEGFKAADPNGNGMHLF